MKVSIAEIAKRANVSKATVSRVLNDKPDVSEKTRKKIFKIIDELNYIPNETARNLSLGIVKTVALIVPSENPVYIDIVRKINNKLFEKDMDLLFYITDHNPELEKKQLRKLKGKNLAGLIYIKSPESDNSVLEFLDKLKFPKIVITEEDIDTKYDQVYFDERLISYQCADILLNEGHKNIAYLSTPLNLNYEKKRYDGIIKALENNKEDLDTHNFYFPKSVIIKEGYEMTKKILDTDITAICSLSNILTFGCIKAFKEMNVKINDNISLISFGELGIVNDIGYNITTVWISNEELSKVVVDLICRRIENPNCEKRKIELKPNINLRGSEKIKMR
ncbi:MAG: LacI family transcriptional regulator [Firmicutes bacterium]|nr:LacI family transcriptional regulator [Bacillota bacterium]